MMIVTAPSGNRDSADRRSERRRRLAPEMTDALDDATVGCVGQAHRRGSQGPMSEYRL